MGEPIVTDDDGIRWITLDRPEILNSLYVKDLDRIAGAVRDVDDSVRAIALTGTGRAFSGGMHLDTFADATPDGARASISRVRECVGALRLSPLPTVAVLNGYCLGAAFEMALACDLRVAHPGVQVGLPEVRLGVPSVVEAALLYRYLGLSKAKEILLTGALYPIGDFAAQGLANRTVEPAALRETAVALLDSVTACTSEVIAAQKHLIEMWLNEGLQHSIDASVDTFADLFDHPATTAAIAQYQRSRG